MNSKNMTQQRTISRGVDLRFTGFINYDGSATPINTISDLEGNNYGFSLSQFQNFEPLASVYEQVRVDRIRLKIFNVGAVGSTLQVLRQVMILYAYDPDGGTENTKDIFSRANMQSYALSTGSPTVTLSGVPGTVQENGLVQTKRFYDTANMSSLKFFLGKICAVTDGFNNDPSGARLNLVGVASVDLTFKGLR